jgi:glycine/D-amino acid oxidase-like deaminating enzyme
MFDPNGGSVHALKLVNLLKTAAEDEGVRIYENSPVVQLNEGKTHILKVASGGQNFEVKCSDVVVATNAYTSKLGIFKRQIMPVHTQCAATYPLTQAQKDAIGWEKKLPFFDSRVMLYHLVFTEDNRIVIGGGNVNYYFNNGLEYQGNLARVSDMMLEELIHLYPELKGLQFEYVWNGILGTSYDEVETVGVTGEHENIYYGLAYNGHGVNQSILFGNVIAHLYAEEYHAWEDTQFYGKTLSKVPVEPFRYMGANLFFKYWRWKDKRR